MYQESMFTGGPFKGAQFIANGCYGAVYDLHNGWVVKYAVQDGTLNYLEWCKAMQAAGRGMLGMPEIDAITHLDGGRYMVTMRKYAPADTAGSWEHGHRHRCGFWTYGWPGETRPHIDSLLDAFREYIGANFMDPDQRGPQRMTGDLHSGNFMYDGDTLILTDPSGHQYLAGDSLLMPEDMFN